MGWCLGLKVHGCSCTGVCLEGESREEVELGRHSPPIALPEGLGRRMLRLCTPCPDPLPVPCLPQTGELALGSVSTVLVP